MFGCVLITAPHTIFISALSHLFVTVEFLYSLSNLFEWESLCNKEMSCWSILSSLWLHCNLQSVSLFGYLSLIYSGVPFNVSFSLTLTLTVWLWLLYVLSLKKTSLETYFAFNDNIQNLKHFDLFRILRGVYRTLPDIYHGAFSFPLTLSALGYFCLIMPRGGAT